MGVIRFLLALSVAGAHGHPFYILSFIGGDIAVQAFFVISGFYMAMIIGSYKSPYQFWISRYLRLYPTYIICAFLVLVFRRGIGHYISDLSTLPTSAITFFTFTNLTMFLQDLTKFLRITDGSLRFVKLFGDNSEQIPHVLLLPQGWTLGIEISFYMLAPFILNRSVRIIIFIIFLSVMLRIGLIEYCCSEYRWTDQFFPTQIAVFLLGSLAYKLYESKKRLEKSTDYFSIGIFLMFLLFLADFNNLPIDYKTRGWLFLLALTFSINSIFHLTKNSKLDNFVGALSYPVYVSQFFVLFYLRPLLDPHVTDGGLFNSLLFYGTLTVFSAALYFLVEKPVNAFRHRLKTAAVLKGTDVDQPRNLAKSVTVE